MTAAVMKRTIPATLTPHESFPQRTAPFQSYEATCRPHREKIKETIPEKKKIEINSLPTKNYYIQTFVSSPLTPIRKKRNISSRFPGNSEAPALELLGNLEEMFPRYHLHAFNILKSILID